MRPLFALVFCLSLLLGVTAEPQPDLEESKRYQKDALEFSYPGNWKIYEDSMIGATRVVIVESPDNAILTVFVYDATESRGLPVLAQDYSAAVAENMPIGFTAKSEGFKKSKDGRLTESVRIEALGEIVPHFREYTLFDSGDRMSMVVSQVATEDMPVVGPGFRLIESTLKLHRRDDSVDSLK